MGCGSVFNGRQVLLWERKITLEKEMPRVESGGWLNRTGAPLVIIHGNSWDLTMEINHAFKKDTPSLWKPINMILWHFMVMTWWWLMEVASARITKKHGDSTIIGHLSPDVHRALGTDETHPKATL